MAAGDAPSDTQTAHRMQRLAALAGQYEIRNDWVTRLRALENYDIVVIADDSGSMQTQVATPGVARGPYAPMQTRWTELRQTLSIVVELASALNDSGVDVFFLNRPPVMAARSAADIQPAFDFKPPQGFTPLTRVLSAVLAAKANSEKNLLIVIATDGQPTDDRGNVNIPAFINCLTSKGPRVAVQIMACTDDNNAIAYLDSVDRSVPRVDVSDDFFSERAEVLRAQGAKFHFTFGDYVVKALLGSIDPYFDALDDPFSKLCCSLA
jgi:hypothetical protein